MGELPEDDEKAAGSPDGLLDLRRPGG